jgi:hypothetical protein
MRKKIILGIGAFLVLFFLLMVWYDATYSMEIIDSFEINTKSQPHRVLIASQGSEYKEGVVRGVMDSLKEDSVYLKVVDVSSLNTIQPEDWDAIIIIHTWEIWKPEENSKRFLDESYDQSKMYVVTTSGSGERHIDGIDGITGASDLNQVSSHVELLLNWLDETLSSIKIE